MQVYTVSTPLPEMKIFLIKLNLIICVLIFSAMNIELWHRKVLSKLGQIGLSQCSILKMIRRMGVKCPNLLWISSLVCHFNSKLFAIVCVLFLYCEILLAHEQV